MTIEFRCSQCNQLLRVPDASAGKNARCPKCSALMQVPSGGGFGDGAPPPPPPTNAGLPGVGAPVPPPAGGSDPFSFLKDDAGKSTGASPTSPPPKGSFGDTTGSAPNVNPYASPAGSSYAYQPAGVPYGTRPGLPWEAKGQSVGTWWETTKLCMTQPTNAFSIMRQYGGLGQPMLYCGYGLAAGFVGQMIWFLPLMLVMGLVAGQGGEGGEAAAAIGIQIVMSVFQGVMGVLIGATIGLLIGAAILHVCLMVVGGARQGYETTLRVLGYAQGSIAWMNVIPIVGPLVGAIWGLVIEIIGVARAHEIDTGKAALAVLLPFIVCCVFFIGIIALAITLGAVAGANA
jgi:hypothetical protein